MADEMDGARARRNEQLKQLLAACALNDRQAFAQLYELTSAKLNGVILRILGREAWAQDCLQEAYVKIWHKAGDYRPYVALPMTWMMTIARNQALDLLRRQRREFLSDEPAKAEQEMDLELLPVEKLQRDDAGRMLQRCLQQLQEQQRQIIALAYFRGLTHEELARQTGTPLGTIKTWIRRGLEQLRSCLEP
jgi:RNA polymerase sigma-70 factor (ECF subfamily)